MPSIPSDLSAILVLFAGILSHGLRGDNLPRGLNILIAAVACLVACAVTFWLLGGFEGAGNAKETVLAFILFSGWMAGKELLALLTYLQEAPSPLASKTTSP